MPFAQALLLYICAVGVGEALLAVPVAAAAAPGAVLSSYQIVLPFPGSGGAALHPPFGAFHAPAALVDVESLLERGARPAPAVAADAPAARPPPQQPFYERAFSQQEDSAGRAEYSEPPHASEVQPQSSSLRNPAAVGRSGLFRATSPAGQFSPRDSGYPPAQTTNRLTPANNVESRFASSDSANGLPSNSHRSSTVDSGFSSPHAAQYFQPSQRPAEFVNQAYQRNSQQTAEEISDRHFQPSQQNSLDFDLVLQHQRAKTSPILQYQPFHTDERFSPRSHTTERLNRYLFAYSYPREDNQLLTTLVQNPIQQNRYNHLSNEYSSNLEGLYRQTNDVSLPFNYEQTSYLHSSPDSRPRLSIKASPAPQDHHQSYRVDVEGNGYGYKYAVQSSHNENKEVSARQQNNINGVTPSSHHLN